MLNMAHQNSKRHNILAIRDAKVIKCD